jgi:hypothetical protein
MIKIAAVKANTAGSKIIRWGLGEPASHLLIVFGRSMMAMHFYGNGFHLESVEKVYPHYSDVAAIHLRVERENDLAKWMIRDLVGAHYDSHGFMYFACAAAKRKLFGIPLPRRNKLQRDTQNICTEILYSFLDAYAEICGKSYPLGRDFGVTTPMECIQLLKDLICPDSYSPCPWPWQSLVAGTTRT